MNDTTSVTPSVATHQLLAVLSEAFEGSQEQWSYFADSGPEAGLLGTIERLSAAEASRTSGPGDTTIAAHAHHVAFGLSASTDWILGRWQPRDWTESWRVSTVDADAWAELCGDLRLGYEALADAIRTRAAVDEKTFGGAVGAIAHVAYHLGAIRQKLPAW